EGAAALRSDAAELARLLIVSQVFLQPRLGLGVELAGLADGAGALGRGDAARTEHDDGRAHAPFAEQDLRLLVLQLQPHPAKLVPVQEFGILDRKAIAGGLGLRRTLGHAAFQRNGLGAATYTDAGR